MSGRKIYINSDIFEAEIFSEEDASTIGIADFVIVCVKNYELGTALQNIIPFVNQKTVILPLQNGIFSYEFFKSYFPTNPVLRGYMQGPNTEKTSNGFRYKNPGELHIGSEEYPELARKIVRYLKDASIPAIYEDEIKRMVWKKWMLNIAGNSITALTGADYSLFKICFELQEICHRVMDEFLQIAKAESVDLNSKDIDDIIEYYISYNEVKQTSMLVDVLKSRKTENDYLAGTALQLGRQHGISLPIISTLYYLIKIKEEVYMYEKE